MEDYMSRENLIRISNELGYPDTEIAVSLENYFIGNEVIGSIIPNSYPEEVDPQKLFNFLKELKEHKRVQEILVRICDIDEKWPYTDSIYIYTSLTKDELDERFNKFPPDEIIEGWMFQEPNGRVDLIEPNKVFTIWWN